MNQIFTIMKQKTPKQIYEQWLRIERNNKAFKRVKAASEIAKRYIDNIYKANGVADRYKTNATAECNHIWANAAARRRTYAEY